MRLLAGPASPILSPSVYHWAHWGRVCRSDAQCFEQKLTCSSLLLKSDIYKILLIQTILLKALCNTNTCLYPCVFVQNNHHLFFSFSFFPAYLSLSLSHSLFYPIMLCRCMIFFYIPDQSLCHPIILSLPHYKYPWRTNKQRCVANTSVGHASVQKVSAALLTLLLWFRLVRMVQQLNCLEWITKLERWWCAWMQLKEGARAPLADIFTLLCTFTRTSRQATALVLPTRLQTTTTNSCLLLLLQLLRLLQTTMLVQPAHLLALWWQWHTIRLPLLPLLLQHTEWALC